MTYAVVVGSAARKELRGLPADVRAAVIARIADLESDPRPRGSAPLEGQLAGLRRIRVGSHRVAYHVDDDQHIVTVLAVGPRGSVYERLSQRRPR